jgi:ethanolamine utilization protein EutQ (cupin superfamily)
MRLQKLTAGEHAEWSTVAKDVMVSDRIDAAREPAARMTVGFARVGKGESLQMRFPYDEVLIVTKGSFTVRGDDGTRLTARAGEVIYLPGGSVNTHHADEDTEMVYVAGPPDVYARHVAESTQS